MLVWRPFWVWIQYKVSTSRKQHSRHFLCWMKMRAARTDDTHAYCMDLLCSCTCSVVPSDFIYTNARSKITLLTIPRWWQSTIKLSVGLSECEALDSCTGRMTMELRVARAAFLFLPVGFGGYNGAVSAATLDHVDEGHCRNGREKRSGRLGSLTLYQP